MSDIIIRDANNVSQVIRTFSDATSVHNNASVPINVSGLPIFVTAAPGITNLGASLPAGTNHLGKVSVEGLTVGAGSGLTVSVGGAVSAQAVPTAHSDGTNYRIPYADASGVQRVSTAGLVSVWPANTIVPDTDAKALQGFQADHVLATNYVYNRNSNSWDRLTGTSIGINVVGGVSTGQAQVAGMLPVGGRDGTSNNMLFVDSSGRARVMVSNTQIDVSISPTQSNIPVSIGNSNNIPVSVVGVANVSINGTAVGVPNSDAQGLGTASSLSVRNAAMVFNRNSGTWDRMTGTSVGLAVLPVSIAPQTLTVHVCNALPAAGATQVVSVGGPVSVQAVQIAGRDSAGNARSPLMYTDGALVVHVSNTPPVTQSGTWTVQPGNTANTAPWLVTDVPSSVGGLTGYTAIVSAITSGTLIKGAAGQVYCITAGNKGVTPLYLKLYNTATAPAAATSVNYRFIIPGTSNGGGFVLNIDKGLAFSAGIGYNITGELLPGDTTAPADNQGFINIFYK